MKFTQKTWPMPTTIFFSVVMGILLLINPAVFSVGMIRLAGALLLALGIFDIVKYFRTVPEEALKGSAIYTGLTLFSAGSFCLFGAGWFLTVFPVLAVLYGLIQILISFHKLQGAVDAYRTKQQCWYLLAISAGITLLFGFMIVLIPNITFMSIWVFTGTALLIESVFDGVLFTMQLKRHIKERTHNEKIRG